VTGVNGNGMHTNLSIAQKGKNLFFDTKGQDSLSKMGWQFIDRILASGQEICLAFNPSVNAYRRLDPHYEAPNQIKASAVNRGAMVRIPIGNEKSMRVEIRSIAPDANPYLALYLALRTGLEGPKGEPNGDAKRERTKFLPDNIYDAIRLFKGSKLMSDLLGPEVHQRFVDLKSMQADRCPRALGSTIKTSEVQFHHEVTNQYLWSQF
jgi:glutamine synthetase